MAQAVTSDDAEAWLRDCGADQAVDVAVTLRAGVGVGLAIGGHTRGFACDDPVDVIAHLDQSVGPRWVWWDRETADLLATRGVEIDRCWDVLTVHRLLHGGWRTSIAQCWAWVHELSQDTLPALGQLDLLGDHTDEGDDRDDPVRPDGHLRPEWIGGGWSAGADRLANWASLALDVAARQRLLLARRPAPERALSTARSESAAEFLCAELEHHGLPMDVDEARRIIGDAVGPQPVDRADEDDRRRARDEAVLGLLDPGPPVDLRNPADVKAMLRRVAVDVPDTRAWRLEQHRDAHPVVPALLTWRKAERIATTYGYRWLAEHVRDGRLLGEWSSSDGAAGRMTASAGLHNLPAEMRPAVAADTGHVFVRADLGQIEPRVLAAVSGDLALIAATADDDFYQPVADRLGVSRDIAKVAVLVAMYGATTGESAHALRGLERAYPTAMGYLEAAAEAGRAGDDVMTVGGRRVRMWFDDSIDGDIDRGRRVAAARGRFARNATIQGAAAEFFKVWAVLVRRRLRAVDARVVLCLHDELLVHVAEERADAAVDAVNEALAEAAYRWSPHRAVRYLADAGTIRRWSEAKH
ncbi:MAG: DNA polymerase [Ilumatobacteraceae bacterium]